MNLENRTGFYTITSSASLDTVANLLAREFACDFKRDVSGAFEEYPAFVGSGNGLHLVLLGNPLPEDDVREFPDEDFELQVTVERSTPELHATSDVDRLVLNRVQGGASLECFIDGWSP